ncbi:MAG: hypothetical protein R3F43_09405 [bacterium]
MRTAFSSSAADGLRPVDAAAPPLPAEVPAAPASARPRSEARGDRAEARLLAPGDPVLTAGLGARVGDVWLENPRVVRLLAGLDRRLGPSASGARCCMWACGARRRARAWGRWCRCSTRPASAPLNADQVDILQDGRLGNPTVIRLTGRIPSMTSWSCGSWCSCPRPRACASSRRPKTKAPDIARIFARSARRVGWPRSLRARRAGPPGRAGRPRTGSARRGPTTSLVIAPAGGPPGRRARPGL